MKIGKAKKDELVLFADQLVRAEGKFCVAEERTSKNGNTKYPVICFLGTATIKQNGQEAQYTGDLIVNCWRIQLSDDLLNKFTDDTEKWSKDYIFKLSATKDEKNILVGI